MNLVSVYENIKALNFLPHFPSAQFCAEIIENSNETNEIKSSLTNSLYQVLSNKFVHRPKKIKF